MANRKGIALVMALMIIVVFILLLSSFYLLTMNETNLARRHVDSVRSFWLAEAGIAEGIAALPNNVSGSIGTANHTYTVSTSNVSGRYYQVDSTGTVTRTRGGQNESVSRTLSAVVETQDIQPNNFQRAIETTVDLVIRGSVDINPDTSWQEFAALNFPDMFGVSKADVRDNATHHYTDPPNDVMPVDGITWVDLSPGQELRIDSSTWQGSGILVVSGDCQITGGTFNGIIWVIGKLRMSGNPVTHGAVLAESRAEIDDTRLTGNVTLNYSYDDIVNALTFLQFIAPKVVAWREL